MAKNLRLHSLTVATNTDHHTFDFRAPLTFITGNAGIGKSSLVMLIKHALGGEAKLTPAVREHAIYVQLTLQAGTNSLILRRRIGSESTTVEVIEPGSGIVEQILPIRAATADAAAISRYLMQQMGLPLERVATTQKGSNSRTVAISFNDVFAYCYLQAKEIDRSVVGHLDPHRNRSRIATFDLLFDLIDLELERLKRVRGVERDTIKQLTKDIAAIDKFVTDAGYVDPGKLQTQRLQLQQQLETVEASLTRVRQEVEGLTAVEAQRRSTLSTAVVEATAAQERTELIQLTVRGRQAALAQLRLDHAKAQRLDQAARSLAPFEFVSCPRCMQAITQRPVEPDACLLCCQHVEPVSNDQADDADSRLDEQIAETEALLAADQAALEEAATSASRAAQRLGQLHREFDAATNSVVSPRMETVAQLSVQAENLRQRVREIDRATKLWRQLGQERQKLTAHKKTDQALLVDIKARGAHLQNRGEVLDDLNELFDQQVAELGIPVQGTPHIHHETFLPMVGDTDFEELQASGGGVSTALNVAYHLTLLAYSANRQNNYPNLLIIDSPRKAIGNTPADQALGRRIYQRLMTLAGTLNAQLIVADNDVPLDVVGGTYRIELTADRTTVPGIRNSGVGLGTRVEDL